MNNFWSEVLWGCLAYFVAGLVLIAGYALLSCRLEQKDKEDRK
jgi:hypothetical protein